MVALNCALLEQMGELPPEDSSCQFANGVTSTDMHLTHPCNGVQLSSSRREQHFRTSCPTIPEAAEESEAKPDNISTNMRHNKKQDKKHAELGPRFPDTALEQHETLRKVNQNSIAVMTTITGTEIENTKLRMNLLQFDVESEKAKVSDLQWQLDELQALVNEQPAIDPFTPKQLQQKKTNEKTLSKSVNCISSMQARTTRRIVMETEI